MQPLKGAKFFLKFHVLSRSVSPVMSEPACVERCLLSVVSDRVLNRS